MEAIAENKAKRSTGYFLPKELETSAREQYVFTPPRQPVKILAVSV
jgi:hypothetical protein